MQSAIELVQNVIDVVFKSAKQVLLYPPLSPGWRIYWGYVLAAGVLAIVVYIRYHKNENGFGLVGFLKFLLPKKIYLHSSSLMDYKIYVVNILLTPLTGLLGSFISSALLTKWVTNFLSAHFTSPGWRIGAWTPVAFAVTYALVSDFGRFATHMLHHKLPFLWPLHSMHHSAEVLNPITLYRKHPLYDFVKVLISAPLLGLLGGSVIFLFLGNPGMVTILGINAIHFVFQIAGSNLRHSHVWLSFGPVLNHIFVSPAQHQIHHSARPEHRGKNLGSIFAIWDWMFGTLVLPNEHIRRNLVIGINLGEPQRHPTLAAAYFEPLQRMSYMVGNAFSLRPIK